MMKNKILKIRGGALAAAFGLGALMLAPTAHAQLLGKCQKTIEAQVGAISTKVNAKLNACVDAGQADFDKGLAPGKYVSLLKAAAKCEKSLGAAGFGPLADPAKGVIGSYRAKILKALPGGASPVCDDLNLVSLGLFPSATHTSQLQADILTSRGVADGVDLTFGSNKQAANMLTSLASDFCTTSGKSCDLTSTLPHLPCGAITGFCKKDLNSCLTNAGCAGGVTTDIVKDFCVLDPTDLCGPPACPTCLTFARRDRFEDPLKVIPSEGNTAGPCRQIACKILPSSAVSLTIPGPATIPIALTGNFNLNACDINEVSTNVTTLLSGPSRALRAIIPNLAAVCVDVVAASGFVKKTGAGPSAFGYKMCIDGDMNQVDDCPTGIPGFAFTPAQCTTATNPQDLTVTQKSCVAPDPATASAAVGQSNIALSIRLGTVETASGEAGADGLPCTPDDTAAPGTAENLAVTTLSAKARLYDALAGAPGSTGLQIDPPATTGAPLVGTISSNADQLAGMSFGLATGRISAGLVLGDSVTALKIDCGSL